MNVTLRQNGVADAPASAAMCLACDEGVMHSFYRIANVPTNSCILLETAEEAANCKRGNIELGLCGTCGFVANIAFEPALTEYSGRYEETQAYSDTFNRFQSQLVDELIARHDLHDRHVVEVGCGKGEFLVELCKRGGNRGLGVDPGADPGRIGDCGTGQVEVLCDFFHPDMIDGPVDFLACKMTLEHIARPLEFLRSIREGLGDRKTVLFIQVPDAGHILTNYALEDIYYEHCNYFTAASLARLAEAAGFSVEAVNKTDGFHYLTLEAVAPIQVGTMPRAAICDEPCLDQFAAAADQMGTIWHRRMDKWAASGKRVALWGSGSKAVAFLSLLGGHGAVSDVIDINPRRQGKYMPGTAQRISGPDDLGDLRPDVVIIMNAVYRREISEQLTRKNIAAEIAVL